MMARFFGGSLDGTTDDRDVWGRRYLVPVRVDGRHHRETYTLKGRDETHWHFHFESIEDTHDATVEALREFDRDTMRRMLGQEDDE